MGASTAIGVGLILSKTERRGARTQGTKSPWSGKDVGFVYGISLASHLITWNFGWILAEF